jgi:hypothetical protein
VPTLGWILLAAIWTALAFWPARAAGRKRHGSVAYLILSPFFLSLKLIMAYMVHDRGGFAAASHATACTCDDAWSAGR